MANYFRFTIGALLQMALLSSHASETPCGSGIALQLSSERTGHVSVSVNIGGQPVRMLVDTGANVSTLDLNEGRKLNPVVLSEPGQPPGHGRTQLRVSAAGVELGMQDFSVMDLFFINIPSKKYNTEPFAGQLGASFFTQLGARILFDQMTLCLSKSAIKSSSPQ